MPKVSRPVEENTSEEEIHESQPPKNKMRKVQNQKKSSSEETTDVDQEKDEEKPKKSRSKGSSKSKKSDHPPAIEMVLEAIEFLADRKGCSVQAIKNYVMANFKVQDKVLKGIIRRALEILLKDNLIIRPSNHPENKRVGVMCGRYVMQKKKKEETARTRPSQLRQLSELSKTAKQGVRPKGSKKKKRKRSGFY